MEQILLKLIQPDNTLITEGTKELQEALKKPECIGELCNIIVSSQNTTVRHYAAVVLRKKFSKSANWNKVSPNDREIIKNGILKALVDEPEKQVKKAICQFIAHIANHELPNNWPQLIQLLEGLNTSNELQPRELGMYALGIILEICGAVFKQPEKQASMCHLFNSTLNSLPDLSEPLAYLTVLAMHQYLIATEDPNLNYDWKKVFETIEAQSKKRPDRGLECLDLIDDVMEMDDLNPQQINVADVYVLVLHLADQSDDDDLQEKALNVLSTVIKAKLKPTFYTKNNALLDRSIDVLLKLMSTPPLDDACEDYYIDKDANSASVYAASVLDDMAIHIAPTKLMNSVQDKVVLYLRDEDMYKRKAGYLALASVTEGASGYIRNNFIKVFVDFAIKGIVDNKVVVQNAALFALGQMSEYLQPEISTFADQIMPILLNYLNHVSNIQAHTNIDNTKNVERMFYALEYYIETMEHSAIQYVPALMEAAVRILENPNAPLQFKEYSIRTIGSIATAIGQDFMPYFPQIMNHLGSCVNAKDKGSVGDDYRISSLQNAAVEIIGNLARAVGDDNFREYAVLSVDLGLRMISDTVDDPDTTKVVFQLFASVATILKQEMIYLPNIVELLLTAVENDGEYVAKLKETPDLDIFVGDEEEEPDEEEDIDFDESRSDDGDNDNIEGYTYDCSKLEEKEEALDALRELAQVTGPSFHPYIVKCFDTVFKTLYHPHDGVRSNAVETLVQMCVVLPEGKDLDNCLNIIVPKLREIIKTEESKDVVISALGGYRDLLTEIGARAVSTEGHFDAIHNTIKDVLNRDTECQETTYDDEDEEEAEKEALVVESAGDILPALSKAVPSHVFQKVFREIFNSLTMRLKKSSDGDNIEALKSFIVGTIAQCIPGLGDHITDFIPTLLPILMKFCKDKGSDIKQNSVYGLGLLVATAKDVLVPQYGQILIILHEVLTKDKSGAVVDNVCAAICRLILTSPMNVPLEKVLPVLIENLPLKVDLEETQVVLECLCMLYKNGDSTLLTQLDHVLKVCVLMLTEEKRYLEKSNCKEMTLQLCSNIIKDFPAESDAALTGVPPEQIATYQAIKNNLGL